MAAKGPGAAVIARQARGAGLREPGPNPPDPGRTGLEVAARRHAANVTGSTTVTYSQPIFEFFLIELNLSFRPPRYAGFG